MKTNENMRALNDTELENVSGGAYVVYHDDCATCGACTEGCCPMNAIHLGDDGVAFIDADNCIECGACEDVCPVGAIHPQ